MSDQPARGIEHRLQAAADRGDFTDLPGAGKPLTHTGTGDDWWLRQLADRGDLGPDALPPNLRLRRERDELHHRLDRLDDETAVRAALADLNDRIRAALIAPTDGPPLNFGPIDTEQALSDWRERR